MEGMYKRLFFAALLAFSANEASAQWGTVEEIAISQVAQEAMWFQEAHIYRGAIRVLRSAPMYRRTWRNV